MPPVEGLEGRPVEACVFEDGDGVLQLEAASEHGKPFLHLGLGVLGHLGKVTEIAPGFETLG